MRCWTACARTSPFQRDPAFQHCEALADLVAFFQRVSYAGVVRAAIRETGADLADSSALINIAEQFGQTTSGSGALRTIAEIPVTASPCAAWRRYRTTPPRVCAYSDRFQAFNTVSSARRRHTSVSPPTERALPPGQMPVDLQELLVKSAAIWRASSYRY